MPHTTTATMAICPFEIKKEMVKILKTEFTTGFANSGQMPYDEYEVKDFIKTHDERISFAVKNFVKKHKNAGVWEHDDICDALYECVDLPDSPLDYMWPCGKCGDCPRCLGQ